MATGLIINLSKQISVTKATRTAVSMISSGLLEGISNPFGVFGEFTRLDNERATTFRKQRGKHKTRFSHTARNAFQLKYGGRVDPRSDISRINRHGNEPCLSRKFTEHPRTQLNFSTNRCLPRPFCP